MTTANSALGGTTFTLTNSNATMRKRIARLFHMKMMKKDRQLLRTLLGAVAGSTATKTFVQVAHSLTELGGKRTIETVNLVNRATTAGDITDLNANLFAYSSALAYKASKSANP